jgi:hypothetical protein
MDYPKMIYKGEPSADPKQYAIVNDEAEELAQLKEWFPDAEEAPKRRGRPPKAE